VQSLEQVMAEISGEQILKWHKGNDIWAMVVMTPVSDNSKQQEQYMVQGIPVPI
jgi:hypothetical protein